MTRDRALTYIQSVSDTIRTQGKAPRAEVVTALRLLAEYYDIETPAPLASYMTAWLAKQNRPRRR